MNRKMFIVVIQFGRWGDAKRHWTYANTADEAVQNILDSVFGPDLRVIRVVECTCGSDGPLGYRCPYERLKEEFPGGPSHWDCNYECLDKNR